MRSDLIHAPTDWSALDGRGVWKLFKRLSPDVILLNPLNHRYDFVAYASALMQGIPVWMRCETQDHAFARSRIKSLLRTSFYRCLYLGTSQAFPIGRLNREHWLRHGLRPRQLRDAHYCTPDRAGTLSLHERQRLRTVLRENHGISLTQFMVAFFGKLIPKMDPTLLLRSVAHLPFVIRQRLSFLFVGSGELQDQLEHLATKLLATDGIQSHFPGFVNQNELLNWYLAADVVVLPSKRMGETWGLVVNEALQAGCAVVVPDAVGCAADFGNWERFRTIPVGSAQQLAQALAELATYPRSFDWAAEGLTNYSIESAAQALAAAIAELP